MFFDLTLSTKSNLQMLLIFLSSWSLSTLVLSIDNKKTLLDASNKVFLLSIERTKVESDQEDKKINSICRFDFVDKVRSKNIDQSNQEIVLELIGIDYLKNNDVYEINLIFNNNAHIALTTETIEARLEDQSEIK